MGEKLRAALGRKTRIILKAQGADAAAIAFEAHSTPDDLFELIKRSLPPRMVEDFLITDVGMEYCTGNQPISLFAEWDDHQRNRRSGFPRKYASEGAREVSNPGTRNLDQARLEQAQDGWIRVERVKKRWYPPAGWLPGGKQKTN